jgi:hypothetical protein
MGAIMGAVGPWFVTPHAVQRYIERVDSSLSYEAALGRIISDSVNAHCVKKLDDGAELWRGPKPRRLRYVVSPDKQLMTVMFAFDRVSR